MILDWLIYGVLMWGLVALLNATAFKREPATSATAWTLTLAMFFVNLVVMTALQQLRYRVISQDLGFEIKPKGPLDAIGAFAFSWFFYSLLRKRSKPQLTRIAHVPPEAQVPPEASAQPPASVLVPTIIAIPRTPEPTSSASARSEGPEEQFWSAAFNEFESSSRRTGLWAMAFSEAQGNEAIAKAIYLRLRARELEHEHLVILAASERQERKRLREAELARLSEGERAYELLPKGKCPNSSCATVMPLSAKNCSKCGAVFGGSGWNLAPLDET